MGSVADHSLDTIDAAKTEAGRLALANPGCTFVILQEQFAVATASAEMAA